MLPSTKRVLLPSPVPHHLSYTDWGQEKSTETLFCVHGLARNGRDFDFVARVFAEEGYRVICPDMPGRGKSDNLNDPTLYQNPIYASDCIALLKTLDIPRVTWLGTSMGGIVGMLVASIHPQCIDRLILNDIGTLIAKEGLMRIASYIGKIVKFPDRAKAEAVLKTLYAPFGLTQDDQWSHLFRYSIKELPDGTFAFTYDPLIMQVFEQTTEFTDIDLSPLWETLQCPVLLLRGAESDLLKKETAQSMAKKQNVSLWEFPKIGHAPSLMRQEEINVIKNWLKSKNGR